MTNRLRNLAREDGNFTSFLLVGKTGDGKSSTGNSILGKKEFEAGQRSTSITKDCKRAVARAQGHKVIVVDSPGLADTDMTQYEGIQLLQDEVMKILTVQPDGFDAILITIPHGRRLTHEDSHVFNILDKFFGEAYVQQFGIIVLTHADAYEPEGNSNRLLEEFTKQQTGVMAEMLEKCQGRFVCFNNKTKDHNIHSKQVACLLHMVINMKQSKYRYTSELFIRAQEGRDRAYLEAKEPVIKQQTEDRLNIILQDIDDLLHVEGSTDKESYENIKADLMAMQTELTVEDKGTGVLRDTISSVSSMTGYIVAIIGNIDRELEFQAEIRQLHNESESLRENLASERTKRFCWWKTFIGGAVGIIVTAASVALAPGTAGASLVAGTALGTLTTAALHRLN